MIVMNTTWRRIALEILADIISAMLSSEDFK